MRRTLDWKGALGAKGLWGGHPHAGWGPIAHSVPERRINSRNGFTSRIPSFRSRANIAQPGKGSSSSGGRPILCAQQRQVSMLGFAQTEGQLMPRPPGNAEQESIPVEAQAAQNINAVAEPALERKPVCRNHSSRLMSIDALR